MTAWMVAGFYGCCRVGPACRRRGWIAAAHAARGDRAVTAVGVGLLIAAASLYLISGALEAVSPTTAVSGAAPL